MSQRQSRFDRDDKVVVMKFGGTSVEDEAAIRRLIAIVQSRGDVQPVVVVSALAGVTDQLLEAGRAASSGRLGAALASVRDIYVRHERLADSLVGDSAYGTLDRELRRSRPAWRPAYHLSLLCVPLLLGVLWWRLAESPPLPGEDSLSVRIAQHAGADILRGASSHLLVATHTFLEMLHYGIWLVAIPLVALRGAP